MSMDHFIRLRVADWEKDYIQRKAQWITPLGLQVSPLWYGIGAIAPFRPLRQLRAKPTPLF